MLKKMKLLVFFVVTCVEVAIAVQNSCESSCLPKLPNKDNGGCTFESEVSNSVCNIWPFKSNITNGTLGELTINSFSTSLKTNSSSSLMNHGLNITFSGVNFDYLQFQLKEDHNEKASCHVFNISYPFIDGMWHNCLWSETTMGSILEMRYQAYNSKTTVVNEGQYIFRVPNPNRIEHNATLLQDWEIFLYIDVSDTTYLTLQWSSPPERFNIQYYLLKFIYVKSDFAIRVVQSRRVPVSKGSHTFTTDSLTGRFYFTAQVVHKNCTSHSCYVSKSAVFTLDNKFKSPLIIAAIGILIVLPGFLYVFHSWRRFGGIPTHKLPVVLIIYKRTMDTHFRVIVDLVMYLRKFCHIRALIEDFDILSADTQGSSSWYRQAFSLVDAVMVVSSPHHNESDTEKAYYNVDSAALNILAEKSHDVTCSLKLFSVILPYCTEKDIPKEAKSLPMFRLPQDLNSVLWYMRFGHRKSCFSKFEFYLFQSQINGGACDYARYGKFLRDALVDANEESRRLWAMMTEAQRL